MTAGRATHIACRKQDDSISPSVSNLPPYVEASVAPAKVAPGEQCSLILYFRSVVSAAALTPLSAVYTRRMCSGDFPALLISTVRDTVPDAGHIRRVYTADKGVSAAADTKTIKPGKKATITITADASKLPGARTMWHRIQPLPREMRSRGLYNLSYMRFLFGYDYKKRDGKVY